MKIRIHYTTQLRMALGIESEEFDVPQATTLLALLQQLRDLYPEAIEQYVLNSNDSLQPSILLCVGDRHVGNDLSIPLQQAEEVTILSVISGG